MTNRNFDQADLLNEDGTVTINITPSNWRAYNISPDTYQTVNGDTVIEHIVNDVNENPANHLKWYGASDEVVAAFKRGDTIELQYDHFRWDHDHYNITREFAEVLCDWIVEYLGDEFPDLKVSGAVTDSWSPKYYNFTTDGFSMDLTLDPAALRRATKGFDVDNWAAEHYRSVSGFMSFVTSRMDDDDWAAQYDGEFRIEYLFAKEIDPFGERNWVMALAESEYEIYDQNTTLTVDNDGVMDDIRATREYMDSGYTEAELIEWADQIRAGHEAGMTSLFNRG